MGLVATWTPKVCKIMACNLDLVGPRSEEAASSKNGIQSALAGADLRFCGVWCAGEGSRRKGDMDVAFGLPAWVHIPKCSSSQPWTMHTCFPVSFTSFNQISEAGLEVVPLAGAEINTPEGSLTKTTLADQPRTILVGPATCCTTQLKPTYEPYTAWVTVLFGLANGLQLQL